MNRLLIALFVSLTPVHALAADAGPAPGLAAPTASAQPVTPSAQPDVLSGEPATVADAIQSGTRIYTAIKSGDWKLAVSLIIMLLIYVMRMFWARIPRSALEWAPALVGMLGAFALALSEGASWGSAALEGFVIGAAANGLWTMVGKKFLGRTVRRKLR